MDTKGIPTGSRSSSLIIDPDTGVPIFTPYVWNSLTEEYEVQAKLPLLHADGGQLVHLTNPGDIAGGGGGGGLTDAQLRATPVPVSGTLDIADRSGRIVGHVVVDNFPSGFQVVGAVEVLNDVGNPLPVSGSVAVSNLPATQPVSGPLTDTQLRNSAVPVSLASVPTHAVTGPLTDAQLRAAAVPVSTGLILPGALDADGGLKVHVQNPSGGGGTVALDAPTLAALETIQVGSLPAVALDAASLAALETIQVGNFPSSQPVTGPLTNTELRNTPVPVSGPLTDTQLRAAAVPISGALTDTQLRAAAVPVSLAAVPSHAVTGPLTNTELRATPVPISGTVAIGAGTAVTYKGRSSTFRILGRAGVAGQNLASIWNGSTKAVRVKGLGVDLYQTVIKAITVAPPIIRAYRVTAAPTNGAALPKVTADSSLTTDAGVVLLQDASADGVGAAVTLTAAAPTEILTQEYAPRFITAAGYEPFDKIMFFDQEEIILRQNQGILLRLVYTLATQNPVTDMWIAHFIWTEE